MDAVSRWEPVRRSGRRQINNRDDAAYSDDADNGELVRDGYEAGRAVGVKRGGLC